MKVIRKFEDVELSFILTDEELITAIASKKVDERVVFFRKLMDTDVKDFLISNPMFNLIFNKLLKNDKT
jgi:hypothetical protein